MSARETGISLESFSFRPESKTYRARYDQNETSASMAVVATLAAALDTDPTEIDQLQYSIDAGALDGLLDGPAATDARVEFTFERHAVAVTDTTVTAARVSDGDNESGTDDAMSA